MAMVGVSATVVRVKCRWLDGRPLSIQLGDDELPVIRIEQVREESAAYRVELGPRTIFDVTTPDARLRLAYEHRRRRWLLEGVDAAPQADVRIRRAA